MKYQSRVLFGLAALVGGFFVSSETVAAANPAVLKHYSTAGVTNPVKYLHREGNYFYAGMEDGVAVFDQLEIWGQTRQLAYLASTNGANDVDGAGNYMYITVPGRGVRVFDVSPTINSKINNQVIVPPTLVNDVITGSAVGLDISGNYLYVTHAFQNELEIYDISSPPTLTYKSTYLLDGSPNYLTVVGNYAYIALGDAGLEIVDITNPAGPVKVSTLDLPGYAQDVAVSGAYAYVAETGLSVINVSNPVAPTRVGSYPTSTAWGIEFLNSPAAPPMIGSFVAMTISSGSYSAVVLFDVTRPDRPVRRAQFATATGVFKTNSTYPTMSMATNSGGLLAVDYSRAVKQLITPLTFSESRYLLTRPGGALKWITPFKPGQKMAGWKIEARTPAPPARPVYVMALLNPLKPVVLKQYDQEGTLLSTVTPFGRLTNGANIRFHHNTSYDRIFLIITPKAGLSEAKVYLVDKTGLIERQTFKTSGLTGNTISASLPVFKEHDNMLVTAVQGQPATLKFWQYASSSNAFIQDKTSVLPGRVQFIGSTIRLK